jgi:DNA helicase II / ATP-dependent DNA helicase PcrA
MKQLYFSYAEQRRLHGIDSFNAPSRFIREIPPALLEEIRPRIRLSAHQSDYETMVNVRGSSGSYGSYGRDRGRREDWDAASGATYGARALAASAGASALGLDGGERMRLGARVRHGKFGEGVVLDIEGQGPHARVQVNFERQGSKWLMLQYANLELM